MKTGNKKHRYASVCLLTAFALWTAAVRRIDLAPIGPENTTVGFASVNRFVHALTGVHMSLYVLSDWLSLVPLVIILLFGLLGLSQWVRRKKLKYVDRSILALGAFYIAVMGAFVFFEVNAVNYRPILIDGVLEASYPSSTTMLVMTVMPTAIMQLRERVNNLGIRQWAGTVMAVFTIAMVLARLISGVHWFSDIVGGALLSAGLVYMYSGVAGNS